MNSTSQPKKTSIRYNTIRNQLIGWGALMVFIYLVYLIAFPLIPSINKPGSALDIEMLLQHGRKWFILVYIAGLGTLFYAYWRVLKTVHVFSNENPEEAKSLRIWVIGIGVLCGVCLLGLYPITAIDVALYVVRSRLWVLYGGSPMIALPANFPQDQYAALAGEFGKEPSPYGPVWELIARIPIQLGIQDIAGGIIVMKVISLFSYIGMAVLIGWHARQDTPQYGVSGVTALAFFALNPLVILEAIGNGHNDMLMLALIMLGLVLWQRDQWAWAALALIFATLVKITGLILLPLFGVSVLVATPNWRVRTLRGFGITMIFVVTFVILYRFMGTFPEVFKGIQHAVFERRGFSPAYALFITFRLIFQGHSDLISTPLNLPPYLFILYYCFLLIKLLLKKITLIEAGFMAYFGQLLLGLAFRIWYPMWLIPFAALNLNSRTYWRTFLFSITAELSILSYYILWRWELRSWNWDRIPLLKGYWAYWTVMTLLTVPWTFGIPLLVPILRKKRSTQAEILPIQLDRDNDGK